MRCKTCDYPLWNLTTRVCPECGTAFLPSQYEFVINSVRFCCPHCEQSYYGTGVNGHLVPKEFNCVTCGQRVQMDEMVLRPAEGVQEQQTQTERMPWLERRQRGIVRAWVQTIGKSMFAPQALIRCVPLDRGVVEAWWYAALTALVLLACGIGLPLLVIGGFATFSGGRDATSMMLSGAGSIVGGTVGIVVLIAIWGATAQGLLRITGKVKNSIGHTYQALLYGIGTIWPLGIPCIGPYCITCFMLIWWAVSSILMLMQVQQVSGVRAAFAVLTFPCTVIVLVVGGYAIFITSLINSASTFGPTAAYANSETNYVVANLISYAASHNGQGPGHAVQLVSSNGMAAAQFVASDSGATESSIPVSNSTLNQFQLLPPNRQKLAAQAAADALPKNVVAHRLGDFVFTYHGINFTSCDPGLWVVIRSLDPDSNLPRTNATGAVVARADGTTKTITGNFAQALAAQNQLRAKCGLPPLPDPVTVTHGSPAAAGP